MDTGGTLTVGGQAVSGTAIAGKAETRNAKSVLAGTTESVFGFRIPFARESVNVGGAASSDNYEEACLKAPVKI